MTSSEDLLRRFGHRKPERLEKGSEFYKIIGRVFDSSTLLTLYHMMNRGTFDAFCGVVSAGKEAHIYCALDGRGDYVAVKIYRIATSDFKNIYRYLAGDPRFRGLYRDRRKVVYAWALREFKNLQLASGAGVPAPKPIDCRKNVLAMEFIGRDGVPYPRMKDVPPKDPEKTFQRLVEAIGTLYRKARLVHSDVSEYNVLLAPDPVLIDFSMATDIRNPMADELLLRDIKRLVDYFQRLNVRTPEPVELYSEIRGCQPGGL